MPFWHCFDNLFGSGMRNACMLRDAPTVTSGKTKFQNLAVKELLLMRLLGYHCQNLNYTKKCIIKSLSFSKIKVKIAILRDLS